MNKLRAYVIKFSHQIGREKEFIYCIINGKDRRNVLKIFRQELYGTIESINEIKNKPGVQFISDVSVLQKMS